MMTGRATRGPNPARSARAPSRAATALALALLLGPVPAAADDSDLCILAAQDASRLSGVPLSVLMAVSASYAASFLKTLEAEAGDWLQTVGACHSRTPEHAARHRATFVDGPLALAGLRAAQGGTPVLAPRENWFPLKASTAGATAPRQGSLVPIDG